MSYWLKHPLGGDEPQDQMETQAIEEVGRDEERMKTDSSLEQVKNELIQAFLNGKTVTIYHVPNEHMAEEYQQEERTLEELKKSLNAWDWLTQYSIDD